MHQPQQARSGPRVAARMALVAALLALVSLGLRAKLSWPAWQLASRQRDTVVALALETTCLVMLALLWWRNQARPPKHLVAERLRRCLAYLLGLSAVGLAVALVTLSNITLHASPGQGNAAPRPSLFRTQPRPTTSDGTSHSPLGPVLLGILAALLVSLVVFLAIKLRRYHRAGSAPLGPEPKPVAQDYEESLYQALAGGSRALAELDDARAAIIACYGAMEESLARAGTAREVADTPDELLARAASTLPRSAPAAASLTRLFYEARFSSHPMSARHRQAAGQAVAALSADLGHMAGAR